MRRLDRYILGEYLGPFLFGAGAFAIILLGVHLTPWMLRLLTRDGYPADVVLRIFVLRLPGVFAMTLPMATIFGSLMCMATLSSTGEIIALRAGGISFPRLSRAVLLAGLLTSLFTLGCNEVLVPYANDAAHHFLATYAPNAQPLDDFHFAIPSTGTPQRLVYARRFDPGKQILDGLTLVELRHGRFSQVFSAERAVWQGDTWSLENVELTRTLPDGSQQRTRVERISHEVGKSPAELSHLDKEPEDMSMAELHRELAQHRRLGLEDTKEAYDLLQTIHMRWAIPWVCLGFALIGAPLGLRPARATTGIGLGLSLIIVFAYYVLVNTMNVVGKNGALDQQIAAWIPTAVVYAAGIGLFAVTRR